MAVEPIPGEPAAVADLPDGRALVVADFHAGIEVGLRRDGVELRSRADERREHLLALLGETVVDRLVVLGDLGDAIGDPGGTEREEIERLLAAVTDRVPVTVVRGNHDGAIESVVADANPDVEVTDSDGIRLGDVGFVHGHTWPAPAVLTADVVCMGHEHPMVRVRDEVGGTRAQRAWLRGPLDATPFLAHYDRAGDEGRQDPPPEIDGELVVFPAFNDLTGGTWINVEEGDFLAPFLPAGLSAGDAYLLDGTRLGDYRRV